ncbi:MAG: single-stranded DNA-binding protein [Microbacterium sp.]
MSDFVTILGNVANDPVRNTTGKGDAVINFRLASTHRWYDNRTGSWIDGQTNWYDVSAFRQLAENAKSSLHMGDPVIVTGRLKLKRWENNGRSGTSAEIEADAIGHNLRLGASAFVKPHRALAEHAEQRSGRAEPSDRAWPADPDPESAWDAPGEDDESSGEHAATTAYEELITV